MTMREEFEQWMVDLVSCAEHKDIAARIARTAWERQDITVQAWEAAYAAGQRAEREACAQAVEAEAVDAQETGAESDYAYNRALEHAAAAIRNRKEQG